MDQDQERKASNFKILLPQICASCVATSFNLHLSSALAFSTFLIPQLEDDGSDVKVTLSQSNWTATITTLMMTIAMIFLGIFIEKLGSLNTMKIASIPGALGWILIATATNIYVVLFGRFLIGISVALGNASTVYVTEITRPDIRGSLLITIPTFVSLGLVTTSVSGYFVSWRTLAWINNIYIILPAFLTIFLPESPVWLIYKQRLGDAKKSLRWFHKYDSNPEEEAEKQFEEILRDHKEKNSENLDSKFNFKQVFKNFGKPTGYKPLLLSSGLFFFQQFSGIYIILLHTIIFFKSMDSQINEKIVPAILAVVRLIMSIITIIFMKYFTKRSLLMASNTGMAICMIISGLFTFWIKEGTTIHKWVPLFCIILYIVSAMVGSVPIPWMTTSEIFPTNIRGFGNGLATAIGNALMSIALQNYRYLEAFLGGSYAIQWFFASISVAGLIFAEIFMPETHNKKLIEIEEYFEKHWVFIGHKRRQKKKPGDGEELKELNTKI